MGKIDISAKLLLVVVGLVGLIQALAVASVENDYHMRPLGPVTLNFGSTVEKVVGSFVLVATALIVLYAIWAGLDWLFALIAVTVAVAGLLFRLDLPEPQRSLDYPVIGALVFGLLLKAIQPEGWLRGPRISLLFAALFKR